MRAAAAEKVISSEISWKARRKKKKKKSGEREGKAGVRVVVEGGKGEREKQEKGQGRSERLHSAEQLRHTWANVTWKKKVLLFFVSHVDVCR